jgi:hypothetical protein
MITLPWTPQEIKDIHGLDIFEATVGQLAYPDNPAVVDALVAQCWQTFRNRRIGDFDKDYWLVMLDDRVKLEWLWYAKLADTLMAPAIAALETASSRDISTAESVSESAAHNESEDLPDVQAGSKKYLTNRADSTGNWSESANSEVLGTRTDGIKAEVLNRVVVALRTANGQFCAGLDSLFMGRW